MNNKLQKYHKKIFLSSPHMGEKEMFYIQKAFEQNWIAPLGENVDQFEHELARHTKKERYVTVLSSGTAAIHLALILLGIGHGDEVLCQSFTFCASANPIIYQSATPIFIGSEKETWNICPDALEKAILERIALGKKPKAIIAVHLYGVPAKIKEILEISEKYSIPLIEDAAESLGSTYQGEETGSFGRFGIYSFNGNKIITTSGGGALIGPNKEEINRAKFLATQARDPVPFYQHSVIGHNYRMSNISAGIGRGQLTVLATRVKQRQDNYNFYKKNLQELGVLFTQDNIHGVSNRWLTTILLNNTLLQKLNIHSICQTLNELNIEARHLWNPLHCHPIFSKYPYYGEHYEEFLFNSGLCLPSASNLTKEELEFILFTLERILK